MNALIATAATAAWLLTWRTTAGFGGGAMIVSERIYLAQSIEPARRAFANGIISAAQSAGTVAGPAFGGFAAAIGGLRAPFVIVAVTSADRPGRHALPARPRARTPLPPTTDDEPEEPIRVGAAGRAARRQPRAAGELRRLHHDLRAAGHERAGVDDLRGRDRLLVLRRRQHPARPGARPPRRPHRTAPGGDRWRRSRSRLRARARPRPAAAGHLRPGRARRRRPDRVQRLVVRAPRRHRVGAPAGPHVRHHQRRCRPSGSSSARCRRASCGSASTSWPACWSA